MYAIYGNIYHQYTPNVSIYIYIPYMDPMGYAMKLPFAVKQGEQKPIDDQPTLVGKETSVAWRLMASRMLWGVWSLATENKHLCHS